MVPSVTLLIASVAGDECLAFCIYIAIDLLAEWVGMLIPMISLGGT